MKNRGSGFLMVEGPPTQIPNGTLNAGAEGPAPRRGYDARQKELDQLLEGMLCDVQDIPDLKSEFRPHVDIDSIPTELSKVCLPLVSSVRSNRVVNGKDSRIVPGSYAPSRHHSMRDEYLRSRVPRAKPAPNDVDPEWASLLMKEFEPVTRRHNERTRAHSESRGPFLPGVSAEDFAFSDFDSPPAASIPSQPHRHPGIGYGSNQPVERKDSLDSQSLSKYFNGPRSQSSEPSVSHHSDFIEYSDLDGFAAESNSFSLHPTPPQHYVAEKRMYDPIDMWEPSPAQSMTWLQKQQQKLRERREARYRSERSPQEIQLISELKGVQSRMKVANVQNNSVGSSRDAPRPAETQQVTQPLAIKVNFSDDLKRGSSPARSLQSEPEATKPAAIRMKRTPSQSSYDRQRSQDSAKSFDELDALEQSILRAQQEAASIRADSVERTATPNFPAECPGTPYLNHNGHHHVVTNASPHSPSSSSGRSAATTGPLSSNDSGFSAGAQPSAEKLPPKSPPSSRRLKWSLQSSRPDFPKNKKPVGASMSFQSSTESGDPSDVFAEVQADSPRLSEPPPPPPLPPPPPPLTPVGDSNDTLKNLLRPAYLRSLSSEDEDDIVAKLNESRDESLNTSKSSSDQASTSATPSGSGMPVFNQRLRPDDIEPVGPRNPVTFVRDLSAYWYKPSISRDDAIQVLRDQKPGTFLVRDSTSFPGAFGLALKVVSMTNGSQNKLPDTSSESVRHFLIETTTSGVRIKGCQNEPVFGSLSALIYQHSVTALALPSKLVLPTCDPTENKLIDAADASAMASQNLLRQGAACNVIYLHSIDVESLTGPQAVRKTVHTYLSRCSSGILHPPLSSHFKVSLNGITITDNERILFFRRHYPMESISYCGLDPEDRKWKPDMNAPKNNYGFMTPRPYFGFVARKPGTLADNQCHIFAQMEPEQPASAIINFVTKVMQANTSDPGRPRLL